MLVGRMRNNNLEIRIEGSSCRPQKVSFLNVSPLASFTYQHLKFLQMQQ